MGAKYFKKKIFLSFKKSDFLSRNGGNNGKKIDKKLKIGDRKSLIYAKLAKKIGKKLSF